MRRCGYPGKTMLTDVRGLVFINELNAFAALVTNITFEPPYVATTSFVLLNPNTCMFSTVQTLPSEFSRWFEAVGVYVGGSAGTKPCLALAYQTSPSF